MGPHEAAKSKKVDPESEPTRQTMRASSPTPGPRRNPSTDQRKARTKMQRNEAHPLPQRNASRREAQLLQAMAKATGPEQAQLMAELEQVRTAARAETQAQRELDAEAMVVAPRFRPVAVHEHTTASTDWLGQVDDGNVDHIRVQGEATLWYRKLHEAVKADHSELDEQARGMARRASRGDRGAESVFMETVRVLSGRRVTSVGLSAEERATIDFSQDLAYVIDDIIVVLRDKYPEASYDEIAEWADSIGIKGIQFVDHKDGARRTASRFGYTIEVGKSADTGKDVYTFKDDSGSIMGYAHDSGMGRYALVDAQGNEYVMDAADLAEAGSLLQSFGVQASKTSSGEITWSPSDTPGWTEANYMGYRLSADWEGGNWSVEDSSGLLIAQGRQQDPTTAEAFAEDAFYAHVNDADVQADGGHYGSNHVADAVPYDQSAPTPNPDVQGWPITSPTDQAELPAGFNGGALTPTDEVDQPWTMGQTTGAYKTARTNSYGLDEDEITTGQQVWIEGVDPATIKLIGYDAIMGNSNWSFPPSYNPQTFPILLSLPDGSEQIVAFDALSSTPDNEPDPTRATASLKVAYTTQPTVLVGSGKPAWNIFDEEGFELGYAFDNGSGRMTLTTGNGITLVQDAGDLDEAARILYETRGDGEGDFDDFDPGSAPFEASLRRRVAYGNPGETWDTGEVELYIDNEEPLYRAISGAGLSGAEIREIMEGYPGLTADFDNVDWDAVAAYANDEENVEARTAARKVAVNVTCNSCGNQFSRQDASDASKCPKCQSTDLKQTDPFEGLKPPKGATRRQATEVNPPIPGQADDDQAGTAESQITDYSVNDDEPFDPEMPPTGPLGVHPPIPGATGSRRKVAFDVDDIMRYEQGEMSEDEEIALFQDLIDTGMAWKLQGHYGRTAADMIDAGVCTPRPRPLTEASRKTAEVEVRCDGQWDGCEGNIGDVGYIDTAGFAYCASCGPRRAASEECRKLTPEELATIKSGQPIASYSSLRTAANPQSGQAESSLPIEPDEDPTVTFDEWTLTPDRRDRHAVLRGAPRGLRPFARRASRFNIPGMPDSVDGYLDNWDPGDPWGSTMSYLWGLLEAADALDIDHDYSDYSYGAGGAVSLDEIKNDTDGEHYESQAIVEGIESGNISQADLKVAINALDAYADQLKAEGKDY